MEFSLSNPEVWLTHPQHPEVQVLVKKLDELENLTYFTELQEKNIPVALTDSFGNPIKDENGEVLQVTQNRFSMKQIIEILGKRIKDWRGLTDRGTPIPWNIRNVKILFAPSLNVTIPNPKLNMPKNEKNPELGIDERETIEIAFWQWINDAAMKDETFDTDPKK